MTPYQKAKRDELYAKFVAVLPPKTIELLRQKSYELYTPMTTLLGIALDNELSKAQPFDYGCQLPETYKEYMYAAEAGRVLNYLLMLPVGLSVDTLVLARREFDIEDKSVMLAVIKELLDKGLVEFFRPKHTTFSYHHSYRRLRATNIRPWNLQRYKNKRIAGEFAHGDKIKSKLKER